MKKKNIALIGFMGAGKSSVAKELSRHLKRELISTDALIEAKEGRSIPQIFKDSGERYFRKLEKKVVAEVSREQNLIIDCGGGVVMDPENVAHLKANSLLIYLWATPEHLYENLKKSPVRRPLLEVDKPLEKIRELIKMREPFYQQADITVDADKKTIKKITQEVIRVIS